MIDNIYNFIIESFIPKIWQSVESNQTKSQIKINKDFTSQQLFQKVKCQSLSHVRLFATPWTVALQAPLSMGFSRQEYREAPSEAHRQSKKVWFFLACAARKTPQQGISRGERWRTERLLIRFRLVLESFKQS